MSTAGLVPKIHELLEAAPINLAVSLHATTDEVRDSILQEGITVSGDAAVFAGEPVDSAAKAQAESDVILKHTLAGSGGYLYAEMGRFLLPEGNYILPNGTYMTTDGGTTQNVGPAVRERWWERQGLVG